MCTGWWWILVRVSMGAAGASLVSFPFWRVRLASCLVVNYCGILACKWSRPCVWFRRGTLGFSTVLGVSSVVPERSSVVPVFTLTCVAPFFGIVCVPW